MRERELIQEILTLLRIPDEDAFVFTVDRTQFSLTIDTLVARTDVPEGMTPFQVGWKAVVMNLSDLAAMGSNPLYFLCSLTIPKDYPALDLVRGIKAACDQYGCTYSGGDINEGELSCSGVALGTSKMVMLRSQAQPGDRIGITGDVGRVYAGLRDLGTATDVMNQKIFTPHPRVKEGLALQAHSCIDISDGLSSELYHIANASRVRIDIHSDLIPVHPDVKKKACERNESYVTWALKSGEEYELLFTGAYIDSRIGVDIGEVRRGEGVFLDGEPMPQVGWEHL